MRRTVSVSFAAAVATCLGLAAPAMTDAATLTDITVFSSDATGNNWNSLLWNTQGADTDTPAPGRYNLYVTPDPLSDATPTFLNGFNDSRTRISVALAPGDRTYSIYGEGVNRAFDPLQHFVLNLYFNGVQSGAGISGVQNLANSSLMAASHPNGLDIFGNAGQAEAGTLSTLIDGYLVTLTAFSWITDQQRDVVWDYWANDLPYASGSQRFDYFGSFTLNVRAVPEPGAIVLLGIGLAGLGLARKREMVGGTGIEPVTPAV